MVKFILKISLLLVFVFTLVVPSVSVGAKEKDKHYTKKNSVYTVTEDRTLSLGEEVLLESESYGETTYAADSQTPENSDVFQVQGLKFARGVIDCYSISSNSYCPWNVTIGGDVINYSGVIVYLDRHEGFLKGWERYSQFNFKYTVNPASSTIRNEASWRLPKGTYKAHLGGTFTTRANGPYSAVGYSSATFEVK